MIKLIPHDLLKKLISNDDLIVDNEQQVLEAILIWSINNHEQSFENLFDNIRFEYISKEHQQMILNQIASVYIYELFFLKFIFISLDKSIYYSTY